MDIDILQLQCLCISISAFLLPPGPFQPSREMMLTFYGFYKQATEGKCTIPKPGFWDIVGKAKWWVFNLKNHDLFKIKIYLF